ncbi:hypothetical protein [Streptomyces sp. NPDC096153]|uniref:hypothetical protein n=1 Tax=Streptomyces sp. NPDC096153 TaxID=3155548 RepID=UPI003334A4BB
MKKIGPGGRGLTVSAQGFGAMGMSGVYGASRDLKESIVGRRAGRRPHPGTRRRAFLAEHAAAAGMVLTADELASLGTAVTRDSVQGARYTDQQPASTNR